MKRLLALVFVLILLPAAAVTFALLSLSHQARRSETGAEMHAYFPAGNTLSAGLGICGAFMLAVSAAFSLLGQRTSLADTLLPVFQLASAAAVLYAVFTLFRGRRADGVVLLIPVCYLTLYLIFLYREDASDPVKAHIAVVLLCVAALTAAALEHAAFAFRNGAPRIFLLVGSLAAILSFCAAAELRGLPHLLFFLGFALIELAFLNAAELPPAGRRIAPKEQNS